MGYINPLFQLPAAARLRRLSPGERELLADLFSDLRHQANTEAELCWARRKGPMAAYWRAVSTYARHLSHVMRKCSGVDGTCSCAPVDFIPVVAGVGGAPAQAERDGAPTGAALQLLPDGNHGEYFPERAE